VILGGRGQRGDGGTESRDLSCGGKAQMAGGPGDGFQAGKVTEGDQTGGANEGFDKGVCTLGGVVEDDGGEVRGGSVLDETLEEGGGGGGHAGGIEDEDDGGFGGGGDIEGAGSSGGTEAVIVAHDSLDDGEGSTRFGDGVSEGVASREVRVEVASGDFKGGGKKHWIDVVRAAFEGGDGEAAGFQRCDDRDSDSCFS